MIRLLVRVFEFSLVAQECLFIRKVFFFFFLYDGYKHAYKRRGLSAGCPGNRGRSTADDWGLESPWRRRRRSGEHRRDDRGREPDMDLKGIKKNMIIYTRKNKKRGEKKEKRLEDGDLILATVLVGATPSESRRPIWWQERPGWCQ